VLLNKISGAVPLGTHATNAEMIIAVMNHKYALIFIDINFTFVVMNKITKYKALNDLIWFIISFLAAILLPFRFNDFIDSNYFIYLSSCTFIITLYFGWIVFPERSLIFWSFWTKFILFFLNFALFFYIFKSHSFYTKYIDGFEFTFDKNAKIITSSIPTELIDPLKSFTIFCGSVSVVFLVLMQLRIVHLIFKYRQVPEDIFRGK
jgi:hypothetical protein